MRRLKIGHLGSMEGGPGVGRKKQERSQEPGVSKQHYGFSSLNCLINSCKATRNQKTSGVKGTLLFRLRFAKRFIPPAPLSPYPHPLSSLLPALAVPLTSLPSHRLLHQITLLAGWCDRLHLLEEFQWFLLKDGLNN